MHEFAIVQRIVDMCLTVARQNNARELIEINLEIGDFSLIIEHMVERAFDILKKGTIAENAALVMKRTPGILLCEDCGKESEIWFEYAKNMEDVEGKEAIDDYEKNITASNAMSGNSTFGRNLFRCKACQSRNTNLIKGKNILIKNIRVN